MDRGHHRPGRRGQGRPPQLRLLTHRAERRWVRAARSRGRPRPEQEGRAVAPGRGARKEENVLPKPAAAEPQKEAAAFPSRNGRGGGRRRRKTRRRGWPRREASEGAGRGGPPARLQGEGRGARRWSDSGAQPGGARPRSPARERRLQHPSAAASLRPPGTAGVAAVTPRVPGAEGVSHACLAESATSQVERDDSEGSAREEKGSGVT